MIAPLLSAHRSQIRERGRLALLLPPCFRQGGEAVAAISRNSELFASPCVLEEDDATLAPSLCCYYLRERKKEESGMRPGLQWAPAAAAAAAAAHRHATLARIHRRTWWRLSSNMSHNIKHTPHVPPSALISVKWSHISCVCIIYSITADAIRQAPEHMRYNVCVQVSR